MFKIISRSRFQALRQGTCILSRCMAVEPAVKDKTKEEMQEISNKLKERRVRILKPFKKDFVENLFIGKLDYDIFEYPDIMVREEVNMVLEYSIAIEKILNKEVNSYKIDETGKIPDTVVQRLKDLKLYTMGVPRKYGGLEFWETENTFLQEILGAEPAISHHIAETAGMAASILRLHGSDEQKEKYYPQLASGESMMCFAYLEDGPMTDIQSFTNTTATLTYDRSKYLLSGKKTWVYNAKSADKIMVFATGILDEGDIIIPGTVLLMIDKSLEGVKVQEPYDNVGLRGLEICDVIFDDVEVSADCAIGSFEDGYSFFKESLSIGKVAHGAQCCALLKKLLQNAIYFCQGNKLHGKLLSEYDHIQGKIGKLTSLVYAVESLVYLLSGRADDFEKPDLLLESFMVKIYASEALQEGLREYLQIVGPKHYLKGSYLERYMRDSQYYALCDETNINLKFALASFGLAHAGKNMKETIVKLRNPFYYPSFALKYNWQNRDLKDEPNLTGDVPMNLPASVRHAAENLEYCISRLRYATEHMLRDRAALALESTRDILALGDIVTQTYALIASISRAMNSEKNNFSSATLETNIIDVIAKSCKMKVKDKALEITQYELESMQLKDAGEKAFNEKEYPFTHPIERSY